MSDFVSALESQLNHHHRLIELMEHARGFYGQQLRDATVVEDVRNNICLSVIRLLLFRLIKSLVKEFKMLKMH